MMPRSHATLWRDPALPHVESRRACHSRACYKAHSHPTFSIGAVDAGVSHFTGAGNGQERLTPGTLVMVPARCVHACNPEPGQAWSYQMLHVAADWLARLRQESALTGEEPGEGPGGPARICRDPEVYRQFCELNRLLFSSASSGEKDAALVAFLGDLDFTAHPPLAPAPALGANALSGLIAAIEGLDPAQLNLDALARKAGVGRYQLIRAFRAATGFTRMPTWSMHGSTVAGRCWVKGRRWQRSPTGWALPTRAISSGCSRPMWGDPRAISRG